MKDVANISDISDIRFGLKVISGIKISKDTTVTFRNLNFIRVY